MRPLRTMATNYVRVLDHDPDLALGLRENQWAEALHRSVAPRIRAGVGPWDAARVASPPPGTLGLLVLDGLLARDVDVHESSTVEFLGAGDVIRPWSWTQHGPRSIQAEAAWEIFEPTELALLDRGFALRMSPWPEVVAGLVERATERARSLAIQMTVRHARVEDRLVLTLWHLADRWGRVRADGTTLKIPRLTHDSIARMIGASRPTVTSIVAELRGRGLIERQPDGYWLLHGEPPAELLRAADEARGNVRVMPAMRGGRPEASRT